MTTINAVNVGLSGASGTGAFAGTVSPVFVTPTLGTPVSGAITNCTGLLVAGGGTSRASATPYAVICGGTTSTGAQQSIDTVGNAGQVLTSNGAGFLPSMQDTAIGGLISVNTFTASGTWTRPSGCTKIFIEVLGGGGGGGAATTDATIGTGGAGGGFAQLLLDVTGLASETITVGAGGAGGVGASGDPGGDSSFGSTVVCTGGFGGFVNGSTSIPSPGTASGGDINISGQFPGNSGSSSIAQYGLCGFGANSQYGTGGRRGVAGSTGIVATGFGAGGGAGYRSATTSRDGALGSPGLVRIWNYT